MQVVCLVVSTPPFHFPQSFVSLPSPFPFSTGFSQCDSCKGPRFSVGFHSNRLSIDPSVGSPPSLRGHSTGALSLCIPAKPRLRSLRSGTDIKITQGNFTRKPTEVNFPSADWLSFLRTQLTVFVSGVCLRSRKIFSALFSGNNFFTRRGHFIKSYKSKGICSIALKF